MKTVETNESNQINEKNDMKLPIKGFQSQNSLTSSLETKFSGLSTTRNTKISLKKVKRKLQQKRFENQISLIFKRLKIGFKYILIACGIFLSINSFVTKSS
jgi:hypothetical protein